MFEKGEDPADVAKFLQGFVAPAMVREWYKKWCSTSGVTTNENLKSHKRRVPMPPIDWDGVKIKKLDEMLDSEEGNTITGPEPEW